MRELFYLTLALITLAVNCATSDFMSLESFLQPLKDEAVAAQLASTATTPDEKPAATQDGSGSSSNGAIITTTTVSEYSSLRPPMQEVPTPMTPDKNEGPLPNHNMENVHEQHKQRIVTYDQRQEGQYNVRADLENFMIVLVPPNPAQGLNLLELLAKSKFRRGSTLAMKERHKHYPSLGETSERAVESGGGGYPKPHAKKPLSKYSPKLEQVGHVKPEFIEGRTPYHVDISANDEAQSRLQPDRQVDVLPPPYYPHLPFNPVHLEAEPTVIQALPPTDLGRYNLLEVANAGYNNNNNNQQQQQQPLQNARGFYRDSRAIRADNLLESNRLPAGGAAHEPNTRAVNVPLYRADLGNPHGHGLYPPVDAPDFQSVDSTRAWRLVDAADAEPAPRHLVKNVDLEFDLIGDDFDNLKLLLGDGLERCAPGYRRDSYGNCREIEGY